MLMICAFAFMIISAVNIYGELKATERSEKRRASEQLKHLKSGRAYDWSKDMPIIIAFNDLAREQRLLTIGKRSCEEIYFLDACANFGESPAMRDEKLVFFSDIKNA